MEQNSTRQAVSTRNGMSFFLSFILVLLSYRDNGLARKVPTIEVNSRRHHAFIRSKKNWPPSIRHQLLKIFPVDWLAPMESCRGCVDQYPQKNIAFCRFKEQFDVVPRQNQYQNQCNDGYRPICTDSQDDCDYGVKIRKF